MFEPHIEPPMNFDTHKYIEFLIGKGLKKAQAESIVEVVSKSRDYDLSKLATKDQVKLVEATLRGEIKEVKGEITTLREEIEGVKKEIMSVKGELTGVKGELTGVKGEIMSVKREILDVKVELHKEIMVILKWMIPLFMSTTLAIIGLIITMSFKS
jgi:predicted  nucleic acid-binding Zn-ribbon protein